MIAFRPHHFLCALGFQGLGYSPSFVQNFQRISDQLRGQNGDDTPITVVELTDDICAPCPQRRHHLCVDQVKITALDRRHSEALDVKIGQRLTWGKAKHRIAQYITDDVFDRICEDCSWKNLGVCQQALTTLRQQQDSHHDRC